MTTATKAAAVDGDRKAYVKEDTKMVKVRVTEYILQIKTQPHTGWFSPAGWGPYYTAADAERARVQADASWMAARIRPIVTDAELSTDQIRDLRALGQTVAVV